MQDAFIHKTERPWPNRRLKIAAIVGHTTATTSRIWVRTGAPGNILLALFSRRASVGKMVLRSQNANPFSHRSTSGGRSQKRRV